MSSLNLLLVERYHMHRDEAHRLAADLLGDVRLYQTALDSLSVLNDIIKIEWNPENLRAACLRAAATSASIAAMRSGARPFHAIVDAYRYVEDVEAAENAILDRIEKAARE